LKPVPGWKPITSSTPKLAKAHKHQSRRAPRAARERGKSQKRNKGAVNNKKVLLTKNQKKEKKCVTNQTVMETVSKRARIKKLWQRHQNYPQTQ